MINLSKVFISASAICLGIALSSTSFSASEVTEAIDKRLQPVGKLCMTGEDCAAAPVAAASSDGPRSGEDIYQSKCFSCHGTGAAGAPKLGSVEEWGPRIDQGIETLYTHALNGFNGMPAKGLCMDCSEDEIKGTVDYLVESAK